VSSEHLFFHDQVAQITSCIIFADRAGARIIDRFFAQFISFVRDMDDSLFGKNTSMTSQSGW
jgi:hypothetical protein